MGRRSKPRPAARPASYRARRSLIALVAALLAVAATVALERDAYRPLLRAIQQDPTRIGSADRPLLVQTVLVPLVTALLVYLLARFAVHALRTWRYVRALHRYARRYLDRYAPLSRAGVEPEVVCFDKDGRALPSISTSLERVATEAPALLLLGEAGSGKTTALFSYLYELTRKRWLLAIILGRAPLPLLVSLATYDQDAETSERPFDGFVSRQVRVFSTTGLAARVPRLLRRGKVCVLCDDLDAVAPVLRAEVASELAAIASARAGRPRVIVACPTRTYLDAIRALAPLKTFERAMMTGLGDEAIRRVLRRSKRAGDVTSELAKHRLAVTGTLPAALSALQSLSRERREAPESDTLPVGRGRLFAERVDALSHEIAAVGVDGDITRRVLGALASALRRQELRVVPIPHGQALGKAVAAFIDEGDLLRPSDFGESEQTIITPEAAESVTQAALDKGVLAYSPDKRTVAFANTVLEAAFAAAWLRAADDGIGALNPELLRPQWTAPVLLWSGCLDAPGDLALRLVRLADTPDTTAVRAGLTSRAEVLPVSLSLALAVMTEALGGLLVARELTATGDEAAVATTEEHLRDILDRVQRASVSPDGQERLTRALRGVEREGGPEIVANIADLARHPHVSRLARAQLITVLGLIASENALATTIEMMTEMDPVLRQALTQAVSLAGALALDPLRAALNHPNERVRERASESLALLGDAAIDTALDLLDGDNPSQRASAARTLGALRSGRAVQPLAQRLDDADDAVRVAAALALGEIATPRAVEALAAAAKHADTGMRAAVAQALGASHDPDAFPSLLVLLTDTENTVRAAAATALGLLGDERGVNALRERRDDPDPVTQHAALYALRRLGRA